jgi:hypothetical protein
MNKNAIVPVRRRSKAITRTSEQGTARPSIRTRGPIVERKTSPSDRQTETPGFITLVELFKEIRAEVSDLPLTVIIHGWGDKAAEDFRFLLFPSLLTGDALWFVPTRTGRVMRAPPAKEGGVILDLNVHSDRRIYNNLVGDIVFFSASEEAEVSTADTFRQRARALVLDHRDRSQDRNPIRVSLVHVALDAGLNVYLWFGHKLAKCSAVADLDATAECAEAMENSASVEGLDRDDFVQIGNTLKDLAGHLEEEFDRRFIFRSFLEKILETYAEYSTLDRDLVLIADEYQLPKWAVESLPSMYIPAKESQAGNDRALVWRRVLDCVPQHYEYQRLRELCGGEFIDLEISTVTLRLIGLVSNIFESHLMHLPFSSENAFHGAVNEALMELALKENDSAVVEKIEQARKDILREIFPKASG